MDKVTFEEGERVQFSDGVYIFSHYDESLHECIFVDSLGKSYNVEADKLGYVHKENL